MERNDQMDSKVDFYSLSLPELEALLSERLALPRFRAKQLFQWVYKRRIVDFDQMSDIAKPLKGPIAELFHFPATTQKLRLHSQDGTRKYLFELDKGDQIESVMIKQPKRMTLCLSSQVGCALGCKFCRTGTMGLKRNLSSSEILRQVLAVIDDAKSFNDGFSNIVFMGMGEPLHNYDNLMKALGILLDHNGLAIAPRRITVSSAGLVPAIDKFMRSGIDVSLAISLNATSNEVRSKIMPINLRYPIEELLATLRALDLKRRRSVTMEYVLLKGINDSDQDLKRLPGLLHGIQAKVNLIPYNFNSQLGFEQPSKETVDKWFRGLSSRGIVTTVRWSKGADVSAACGQLLTDSQQREIKTRAVKAA